MRPFGSPIYPAVAFAMMTAAAALAQAPQSTPFPAIYGVTAHVDDDRRPCYIADFRCANNTYDQHEGTDFGVSRYTNAYASSDGTIYVTNRGCPDPGYWGSPCGGGFGNYFGIETNDATGTTRTIAAHMNTVFANDGDFVVCTSDRVLGLSGSSGNSTGPHTHFQVYYYYQVVWDDPYAGDCSGPQSFWTCQSYNEEICGVACP